MICSLKKILIWKGTGISVQSCVYLRDRFELAQRVVAEVFDQLWIYNGNK